MNHVLGSRKRSRRWVWSAGLLLIIGAAWSPLAAASNRPWGQPGGYPAGGRPWYAPPPAYPGTNNYPFPQPQQQQPPQPEETKQPPAVNVRLGSQTAYVHQNLVITIKVASTGNLSDIATDLPTSDAVLFRDLGKPTAYAETTGDTRQIVNVLHYQLVPLKPGPLTLAPFIVRGTYADGGTFTATATAPVHLNVLPPVSGLHPWLPVHDLTVNAQLQEGEAVGEGRPLELTITQQAVGLVGAQLPSPAAQLEASSLQVYLDNSRYTARVGPEGRLIGTRIDRFTLVPQNPGAVTLPQIIINWWNVDRRRKEQSIIPQRRLAVSPGSADDNESPTPPKLGLPGLLGFDNRWLWGGLIVLAFATGFFWRSIARTLHELDAQLFRGLVGARITKARRKAWANTIASFAPANALIARLASHWAPRRLYQRLRNFLAGRLPRPVRLWFCVRTAQLETNPEDWAHVLRFVLEKRLSISAQKPMGLLAGQLADLHPGSNPVVLERLLRQLEAAVIGRTPLQDFEKWKLGFMNQIRPTPWFWFRRRRQKTRRHRLPTLNPEERENA